MIHEEICTYEVAKLAKEKGFNWICPHYFRTKNKDLFRVFPCEDWSDIEDRINAPTQSLLQRWLRDARAIDIDVYPIFLDGATDNREYGCQIYAIGKLNKPFRIGYAKTYENMLETALKYALENLV